jgi:hypothetical protein
MKSLPRQLFIDDMRGNFPLLWKIAHVSPNFKGKGNPHSSQDYHPISVTSIVCKIMKKIIFRHLFNYMKTNNIAIFF